jgi:hypothetical protein
MKNTSILIKKAGVLYSKKSTAESNHKDTHATIASEAVLGNIFNKETRIGRNVML